jgi:phospholipid transport system substrate-binding protein
VKKIVYSALLVSSGLCFLTASPPAMALQNAMLMAPPGEICILAAAEQGDIENAKNFIQDMAQRGIDFLSNDKLTEAQRKAKFRDLLRSSYDLRTIGRFALGPYWKTASPKQQAEYQTLFEKLVVNVYASRFSEYRGQKLVVDGGRMDGKDVIVTSSVLPADGGEKIDVDWRVRKSNGQYKVIDVIVAGVSQALTQRSDFASVIQQGGGDLNVLLKHLRAN